jgi:hypothetical protein
MSVNGHPNNLPTEPIGREGSLEESVLDNLLRYLVLATAPGEISAFRHFTTSDRYTAGYVKLLQLMTLSDT